MKRGVAKSFVIFCGVLFAIPLFSSALTVEQVNGTNQNTAFSGNTYPDDAIGQTVTCPADIEISSITFNAVSNGGQGTSTFVVSVGSATSTSVDYPEYVTTSTIFAATGTYSFSPAIKCWSGNALYFRITQTTNKAVYFLGSATNKYGGGDCLSLGKSSTSCNTSNYDMNFVMTYSLYTPPAGTNSTTTEYVLATTTTTAINELTSVFLTFLVIIVVYLTAFLFYNFVYGRSR